MECADGAVLRPHDEDRAARLSFKEMPLYDYRCTACRSETEVHHGMNAEFKGVCEACGGDLARVFKPGSIGMLVLIDAGGEDSPHPSRQRDGSAIFNAGLPGVETVVGTRADGKPRTEYRPIANRELGNNRGVREYAKRHGLVPHEAGGKRYRAV